LISAAGAEPTRVRLIEYGPDAYESRPLEADDLSDRFTQGCPVMWLDVVGLRDTDTVRRIGELFDVHPLALEDILAGGQRPKVDVYDDHVFIFCHRMPGLHASDVEQIAICFGRGFVLTFQERTGDCFEPVRDRILNRKGRIRTAGAGYLAYALFDSLVDHFLPVLDQMGEDLETLELAILEQRAPDVSAALLVARRELQTLRRAVNPLHEVLRELRSDRIELISEDTRLYLRDTHDHVLRLNDLLDGWRDFSTGLMDVNLAVSGQQLNEVMKVLTVISTIFIPLSFVAGVYGMNFNTATSRLNMPELNWSFGYPAVLLLMAGIAVAQLAFFWRRGWLRPRRRPGPDARYPASDD
jgi:magnesium transporter